MEEHREDAVDATEAKRLSPRRMRALAWLLFGLLALAFVRLWYVQVVRADELMDKAGIQPRRKDRKRTMNEAQPFKITEGLA